MEVACQSEHRVGQIAMTETRRKALTPIAGEDHYELQPARVSRLAELRRRRAQRPAPTTWQGALKQGLKRLMVMLWTAAMLSLLLDKFVLTGRDPGLGFYGRRRSSASRLTRAGCSS